MTKVKKNRGGKKWKLPQQDLISHVESVTDKTKKKVLGSVSQKHHLAAEKTVNALENEILNRLKKTLMPLTSIKFHLLAQELETIQNSVEAVSNCVVNMEDQLAICLREHSDLEESESQLQKKLDEIEVF